MSAELKTKLIVEVTIGDVENKYPNFQFNYGDKKDFLMNNIVAGLEHLTDEQEYDSGYETVVANGMLDCMESFISIGDKVGFIQRSGYMGKFAKIVVGEVVDTSITQLNGTDEEVLVCKIKYTTDKGKKMTISRNADEIITIYDMLETI